MPDPSSESVSVSMNSKRERCRNWKLYVITLPGPDLAENVGRAILGGADVIQLRDKGATDDDLLRQAKAILQVTGAFGVPLIVNDRVEVARASGADGVHLGQDDGPLNAARSILGDDALIGRSTHSLAQASAAEKEGFDYIGVGPIFATPTKAGRSPVGLECLRRVSEIVRIPFVAVGGIDKDNVAPVKKAGAKAVAVVRAVMGDPDPRLAAEILKRQMEKEVS